MVGRKPLYTISTGAHQLSKGNLLACLQGSLTSNQAGFGIVGWGFAPLALWVPLAPRQPCVLWETFHLLNVWKLSIPPPSPAQRTCDVVQGGRDLSSCQVQMEIVVPRSGRMPHAVRAQPHLQVRYFTSCAVSQTLGPKPTFSTVHILVKILER